MESIMNTLWSESSDLDAAGMNERSVVSDDYTTDDTMEVADLETDEMEKAGDGPLKVEDDKKNQTEEKKK